MTEIEREQFHYKWARYNIWLYHKYADHDVMTIFKRDWFQSLIAWLKTLSQVRENLHWLLSCLSKSDKMPSTLSHDSKKDSAEFVTI